MMRILYVEDNAANLSLVHRVARLGGHEVVNRTSGEATLSDFDRIRPDIVLMDIQLEGSLSGLDVVRQLRQRGIDIPIIAVTAYAMLGDREEALGAGCSDYISKPLPIPRLVELLKHYAEKFDRQKRGELPGDDRKSTDATIPVRGATFQLKPTPPAPKQETPPPVTGKLSDAGDDDVSEQDAPDEQEAHAGD